MKKRTAILAGVTGLVVAGSLGLGAATGANAAAYAYAFQRVTNFGILNTGMGTLSLGQGGTLTTQVGATYNGSGPSSAVTTSLASGVSNVAEVQAGPGVASCQDCLTPRLQSALGSRADSGIIGGTGWTLAEARTTNGISATSNGGAGTTFDLVVSGSDAILQFTFDALVELMAMTDNMGESALAGVSSSYAIALGAGGENFFIFAPDGEAVGAELDPFSLNQPIASNNGGTGSFSDSGTFRSDAVTLAPGTYTLNFLLGSRTSVRSAALAVPEPEMLTLFGFGLVGLGFAMKRRKA